MNLLLVDDDHIIIKGITNILKKIQLEKLNIYTARNAIDALDIAKYNSIDLVVTDIDMPVMNGLELIEEIQNRRNCKRYIILSGYDKFEFARKAIQYKVIDYLLKPIDKAAFTALIQSTYNDLYETKESASRIDDLPIYSYDILLQDLPENLQSIMIYLQENCLRVISLEELGQQFHLNPNYICYLFQTYIHTTFLHYLECLRLQKSVLLLIDQEELSVERVAALSGFLSERQFYKVFKKNLLMTPGAFRKKYTLQLSQKNI